MTKKKENAGGVGRNKEIDDVALFNHFMNGMALGLSVEAVGNAGYKFIELKRCPNSRTLEHRERYLAPETAKRRFRAIKSNPFGYARRFCQRDVAGATGWC